MGEQENLTHLGNFEPEAWGCIRCGIVLYVGTDYGRYGYTIEPGRRT